MRRTPALPFEAFKYTGAKRSRSPDHDNNAPSTSSSPPVVKTNAASPAPPPLAMTTASSPPNRIFPPHLLSKLSKPTTTNKSKHITNTAPPRGVPTELLGNKPLRLIIIGHNPSEIAWKRGHYYANPSNWMWRILRDTSLAPADIISGCTDDFKMPELCRIGFTDVGSGVPGTDSTQFKSKHFEEWRQPFYDRLAAHMKRASESVQGCRCGMCGAPAVVAFSGKKQFSDLFITNSTTGARKRKNTTTYSNTNTTSDLIRIQATKPASIPLGKQAILPSGWPLPLDKTEVWVMTSTSGAAAMTREARYAPWNALAERLQQEPWPFNRKATGECCCGE